MQRKKKKSKEEQLVEDYFPIHEDDVKLATEKIESTYEPGKEIAKLAIEKKYSKENRRTINIDPGYIEKAKFILVTTKNYSHRIYLGSGIFADLQYRMKDGKFQVHEWTYPDYRQKKIINFFNQTRSTYLVQLGRHFSTLS